MKKKIIIFLTLANLILITLLFFDNKKNPENEEESLTINNQTIILEIAKTPQEISQGLSGREFLPENKGLLFIFPQPGFYSFWMKDMKFNLDFVFIKNNQVVYLMENVPFPEPGEKPLTINSSEKFDKVLEVNQDLVKKLKIKVNDQIVFSF